MKLEKTQKEEILNQLKWLSKRVEIDKENINNVKQKEFKPKDALNTLILAINNQIKGKGLEK